MKMPSLLLIGLVMIIACGFGVTAQTPDPKTALEQGVCAFKNRDYRLAQTEFERGLQQDPSNKLLMLFAARAADFQVDPKSTTPANIAKARTAVEAYSRLLAADADDAEAASSIVRLYELIDAAKLPDIAANNATPKKVRTAIYIKLAAAGNTCANDITDENKTEVVQGRTRVYKYRMPKDPKDLAKAKACAADGMKLIDQALALDTNNESAWSYKASLSIQSSRLAEMQQLAADKARFDKDSLAARTEYKKLADQTRAAQEKADLDEVERASKQQPTEAENIAKMAKFIATGRVTKKVAIDKMSVDSRDMDLILPPGIDDGKGQKPVDPPDPPIVWKAVAPPDGKFKFVMPSPFDVARSMYFAKGEGLSFLVSYVDLPADHPTASVEDIIGGTASAMADSVCAFSLMAGASCDVRLAKKTTLGSYAGFEYTITEDNCIKAVPGLLRVYATPNRVYSIAAIGGNESDPRVAKFLNSFAITK